MLWMFESVLLLGAVGAGAVGEEDLLLQVECEVSEDGYLVPDPAQCDRYAECTPHGRRLIQLCTDGYALDVLTGKCDLLSKVDCTGRDKLQTATGSGLCPRLNGYFPVPATVSCAEYVDCRDGQPFMQSCGVGAVFDPVLGCVHPDQTSREGCTASDVFGFKCPKHNGNFKFGDHNRVAHPTDCAYFYACLSSGQPRLLGCTQPKVFNPASGICEDAANVPGCEDYYPPQDNRIDIEAERLKIEEEIRAEIEAKFGLSPGALAALRAGASDSEQASSDPSSTALRSSVEFSYESPAAPRFSLPSSNPSLSALNPASPAASPTSFRSSDASPPATGRQGTSKLETAGSLEDGSEAADNLSYGGQRRRPPLFGNLRSRGGL